MQTICICSACNIQLETCYNSKNIPKQSVDFRNKECKIATLTALYLSSATSSSTLEALKWQYEWRIWIQMNMYNAHIYTYPYLRYKGIAGIYWLCACKICGGMQEWEGVVAIRNHSHSTTSIDVYEYLAGGEVDRGIVSWMQFKSLHTTS